MKKKKLVEQNALLQAIEMGTDQEEVMARFGFKTATQLKVAYTNALIALGKIASPKRGRPKKPVSNKVSVNGRGSLVLPKKLVESLELGSGARFRVEKTSTGLALHPVEKPPKTILKKRRTDQGRAP